MTVGAGSPRPNILDCGQTVVRRSRFISRHLNVDFGKSTYSRATTSCFYSEFKNKETLSAPCLVGAVSNCAGFECLINSKIYYSLSFLFAKIRVNSRMF